MKDTKFILIFFLRALRELRSYNELRMIKGHDPPEGLVLGSLWYKSNKKLSRSLENKDKSI